MNAIKQKYKTFENAFKDYVASFMEAEADFGNRSQPNEKELARLKEQFKPIWEAEDSKLEQMTFRYY